MRSEHTHTRNRSTFLSLNDSFIECERLRPRIFDDIINNITTNNDDNDNIDGRSEHSAYACTLKKHQ